MDSNPLISVIIPVFKVERFLVRCVNSVLNQTYNNLEIILVDDGSPDECPRICDRYMDIDTRIKVIHKPNGGQGSARNMALDIIKGKYVSFLDSDDMWDKDFIEFLYNKIVKYNADIAISNYRHSDEQDNCIKTITAGTGTKIYSGDEAMRVALYWKEFGVAPWAKLFKSELWQNVRFKEDRIYEDLATTYLIYNMAEKVVFSDVAKMSYRIRANSDIHQAFNAKKIRILDSANEILDYCIKNVPSAIKAAKSREVATACFIYFRIPDNELKKYQDTVERCKRIIKCYRFEVMRDKQSRKKTRMGAALSYLGFGFERKVFHAFIK